MREHLILITVLVGGALLLAAVEGAIELVVLRIGRRERRKPAFAGCFGILRPIGLVMYLIGGSAPAVWLIIQLAVFGISGASPSNYLLVAVICAAVLSGTSAALFWSDTIRALVLKSHVDSRVVRKKILYPTLTYLFLTVAALIVETTLS